MDVQGTLYSTFAPFTITIQKSGICSLNELQETTVVLRGPLLQNLRKLGLFLRFCHERVTLLIFVNFQ
jgi:hypothetical protein